MSRLILALSGAALSLLLIACGSDSGTICDKLDECNFLVGISASECADEIDDAVEDSRLDGDTVSDCADCLDNNTCSEIGDGDCANACGGVGNGPGGGGNGDPSGGGNGDPVDPSGSGLDGDRRFSELSSEEQRQICEWSVNQQGGPGHEASCDGDVTLTTSTVEECIANSGSTCTVAEIETCAARDDLCDLGPCAALFDCAS